MRIRQCFRYLFRREELSSDLEKEMAFHLEMRKQRQMDKGKLPAEAASEAHLRFGNITLLRERTRDSWRFTSLETAWRDIIQSLRSLTRTPVFTGVAIASLALGIGANAAIFSLIDRLLMATLPVEAPDRLAVFDYLSPYPTYEWLRDHSPAFMGIAAVARISGVHEADNPQDAIEARLVTGNYFDVLKARPFMGRTIASEDDIRGAPNRVVVLSYPFWRARFQGDPDVIGRTLALRSGWLSGSHGTAGFENGAPGAASAANFTIIGVAGPGFAGETVGRYADIWVPMGTQEHFMPGRHWLARSSARWLQIIGRLKPGVAIQNAQTAENVSLGQFLVAQEGSRVTEARRRELQRQHVTLLDGSRGFSFWTREFSKPLWVLQAMVAVVLLLACVNLANLQMARAAARRREIATRLALGAGRFRLLRQLLFESVLLAFCGSVAAIPLAWYGGKFLFAMASRGEPGTGIDLRPDTYTLAFTAGLGLLVVLIFGLAPAVQAMNVDVHMGLKENGVRHCKQPDRLLSSKALAATQVALATVLLVCTALFTRTLFNLKVQKLGYAPNRLILMHIDPTSGGYSGEAVGRISVRLLSEIRGLPGVRRSTFSENGLFSGLDSGTSISVKGFVPADRRDGQSNFDQIGPDYFSVIGIPLLMGREFTLSDSAHRPRVAIVNQAFADHFFHGRNPVGEQITDSLGTSSATVVGVVQNVRDSLHRDIRPRFYVPLLQPVDEITAVNYEVRTGLAPPVIEKELRSAVATIDPNIPILSLEPLNMLIDSTITRERIIATLSICFGLLALMLAVVGLYGLMAYIVARRTREIGIRMAVGARGASVVWMILRDSLGLITIGILIGVPSAFLLSRYLDSLLFGLKANDISTYVVVSVLLTSTALLATLLPARRASRIDPVAALRCE